MRIWVIALRDPVVVQQALIMAGWQILGTSANPIEATHPDVLDEESARNRLEEIGLLISRDVRIEFPPTSDASESRELT